MQQEKKGNKRDGKNAGGTITQSCHRFYSLSLMEVGFQARLIFGVIQAGSPYGLMFNVPEKFRKVTR